MYRLACRGSYSLHGRERPCGAITARDNTRIMSRLAGPRLAVLLVVCASCGGASSSSGNDAPGSDGSSNPFAFEGSHAVASPCQIIDGAQPLSAARGLSAGNYTLCVVGDASEVLPYHLNIAIH